MLPSLLKFDESGIPYLKKLHFGPKWEAESFSLKKKKITEATGSTL